MKASLDTNVIIHLYRAGLQSILFDFFSEGVFIYEQIRNIELEHHGKDVLEAVDADIASGIIIIYTEQKLKEQAVFRIFESNVKENRWLYGTGDLGEVYAISLAQTLGAYALVTDDIKQFTERREKRAKELGIALYVLGADRESVTELQKLEDYIMENFIDLDLDVPEEIKEKYLALKKQEEKNN